MENEKQFICKLKKVTEVLQNLSLSVLGYLGVKNMLMVFEKKFQQKYGERKKQQLNDAILFDILSKKIQLLNHFPEVMNYIPSKVLICQP